MNNKFNEKHVAVLKVIDTEIADFYIDWRRMRASDEFETVTNLSAHLAREILESLRQIALKEKKVPKHIERTWKNIVDRLEKFRHRHKLSNAPYKKEKFNEVWSEFETLLVYIVESDFAFHSIAECHFMALQDSLMKLKTKLDKEPKSEWPIPSIELSDPQSEINQNLQTLAPLLAAFYRDWLKIRKSTNFKCRSYLLAHLAREIDGGFRNILSIDKDKKRIEQELETKGHIASIRSALGVRDPNLRSEQWIQTTKDLFILTHKNNGNKAGSLRKESESLWPKFEELLAFLVGGYLNLLNRVDKILNTEQPNENMVGTLRDLLKPEVLNKYFFQNLKPSMWLKPLEENGWFNSEDNPMPQEDPAHPGYYYTPRWYALEYVGKVADYTVNHRCDETFGILVDIVNDIVKSAGDHRNRINNKWTDWQTIKIIGALPIDQIRCGHITFMGITLRSKWRSGLVDQEISQTILPKLLDAGAKELTLILLKVMFDSKVVEEGCDPEITETAKESILDLLRVRFGPEAVNCEIIADVETYEPKGINREITYMQQYCLRDALTEHGESIAKLCGIKAADIALEQIRILIAEGVTSFDHIQLVRTEPADVPRENYAELLVGFVSRVLQFAEPTTIVQMLADLLQAPQTIIRRIALTAVTHHYSDLKQMFWEWKDNPLEEISLKPELYQLIQTNCAKFKESEVEQILSWVELAQYTAAFAKDDETRSKAAAYKKREWLSALLETGNEKVIAANQKYEQINPAPIEHPGLLRWTESWWGETSPMTVEKLSSMPNTQIAEYLTDFKEMETFRGSDPTENGLAQTLGKCVEANPQKFTDNLLPFQEARALYQSSLLRGFQDAWRDEKDFDWAVLLKFIHQILLSEQFWGEQYEDGFNYRNWVLSTAADLISDGTKDDTHAFDVQLLPLAEDILLRLVEKAEPNMFTPIDSSFDALSSDRGKIFSAIVNYALRFARNSETKDIDCQWSYAIRADFTKRLDRSVETSLEFSYTLGFYLPNLLYLDDQWVFGNINRIFPQQDEDHWQAAFSAYLSSSRYPRADLYAQLKEHGHYQKALNTKFTDKEVLSRLVSHLCVGWIRDWETLDNDTSLIYQLMNSRNPNLLYSVIHFFFKEGEVLSHSTKPEKIKAYEKLKIKVIPAWRALFKILSRNSTEVAYQRILSPLSAWLGLVDEIDTEILESVKASIKYIDKVPGYGMTLSRVIEALLRHVLITPRKVGEIYLEIPKSEMWYLQGVKKGDIEKTVRILYEKGHKDIANDICNHFAKEGINFLKPIYQEYQH